MKLLINQIKQLSLDRTSKAELKHETSNREHERKSQTQAITVEMQIYKQKWKISE